MPQLLLLLVRGVAQWVGGASRRGMAWAVGRAREEKGVAYLGADVHGRGL